MVDNEPSSTTRSQRFPISAAHMGIRNKFLVKTSSIQFIINKFTFTSSCGLQSTEDRDVSEFLKEYMEISSVISLWEKPVINSKTKYWKKSW